MFEIKNAIELGELTAFIQISRKEIKQEEDEKPEEIIIEKPKKEIKKEDGEEGEENQEEEPPEEENPDGLNLNQKILHGLLMMEIQEIMYKF